MMRWSWFFSFNLILFVLDSYGQEVINLNDGVEYSAAQLDSIRNAEYELAEINADTIRYPLISGAAVLIDYGKLSGLFFNFETKYEIGAHLELFNILFFTGEAGMAILEPNDAYQNGNYRSEGRYFRVGLGLKKSMGAKNNFFFSGRYGRSTYSDKGTIRIESPSRLYAPFNDSFSYKNLSASWYEFVLSSETRVWKRVYLGCHIRLRILNEYQEQLPIDTYSIPGYGRTIDKTIPALNLYIKYALNWYRIVHPDVTN